MHTKRNDPIFIRPQIMGGKGVVGNISGWTLFFSTVT